MATSTIDLKCPNCGAAVSLSQQSCKYCKSPVTVTTFSTIADMSPALAQKYAKTYKEELPRDKNSELATSLGFVYAKLRLWNEAEDVFRKVFDENPLADSEVLFFLAISMLDGKKAFLQSKSTIEDIMRYLGAAIQLEPRGIYYYFSAYIKYDYYERKRLNIHPNFAMDLQEAVAHQISPTDIDMIFGLLGLEVPTDAMLAELE